FTIADRVNLSLEEIDDLEKREQFERERIGAIELGKAEGIQIGQINLIKRQLQRHLGELNQEIEDRLSMLSSEQLSALGEAIFDFYSVADLSSWLETNCSN
ncbi:MAG: DUF4351 domain-containing protein, partial [Oscillatoriales cyanobacterium]